MLPASFLYKHANHVYCVRISVCSLLFRQRALDEELMPSFLLRWQRIIWMSEIEKPNDEPKSNSKLLLFVRLAACSIATRDIVSLRNRSTYTTKY